VNAVVSREEQVSGEDDARGREENAKRRQILDGAREVFLKDGFDAASMNEIARRAGVSKGTLYVYFASKEALFEALIREEKSEQAERTCQADHNDHDVEKVLRLVGQRLIERMLRPSSIAHLRIVAAVAPKFPSIGKAFYEAGPLLGRSRLSAYLKAQVEAGIMEIDDVEQAATVFTDLCKSVLHLPVLLCVRSRPSEAEIAAHVAAMTAIFLRAFPLKAR
jgi:AcrR family transcriptional regulator